MRQEDFARLYDEHAQALFAFLAYRTSDRTLAQDLLGDTFERAFRSRRHFSARRGSEKTWLYTIALNCLRDRLRKGATEARAMEQVALGAPEPPYAERALDRLADRDELSQAIKLLTPEEREAIALRYGADLTLPEVARVTGQSLRTAERRVAGALAKLREELTED
jgi:RNA polymerase sigma-70 factor, ECF subfamily